MPAVALDSVLDTLRAHEADLRRMGVLHAAVFGSVARGEATPESDVDVLVELDPAARLGVYQFVRIGLDLEDLLGAKVDLTNKKTLKPRLRDNILRGAIYAF